MRHLLSLLILSLMLPLSAQELPPVPHSKDFRLVEPYTVSGKLTNLPKDWTSGTIKITPVTLTEEGQIEDRVDIDEAGNFSYTLPVGYPAVEVWFNLEGLYFGCLWLVGDLTIKLNYRKLKFLGKKSWASKHVRFGGKSGTITQLRNEMIEYVKKKTGKADQQLVETVFNREIVLEEKIRRIDSLCAELYLVEDQFLTETDNDLFTKLWLAERESDYLQMRMIDYWGGKNPLPDDFNARYLKHQPRLISNNSQAFYRHHYYALSGEERKKAYRDTIGTAVERYENYATLFSQKVDERFTASNRGDVLKLLLSNEDIPTYLAMLTTSRPTVTTPWVAQVMDREIKKLQTAKNALDGALSQQAEIIDPADLGTAIASLPFGADLYETDPTLSGQELLDKIRGAFPNKSLYFDFWAVWCGPCIQQMPFSAKLHKESEGLPVEFIYLCTEQGGSQKQWKNQIADSQVGGVHLFVSKSTHQELMRLFNGRGYPTYALIPPQGEPQLDVPRPSQLDREKLQELLK